MSIGIENIPKVGAVVSKIKLVDDGCWSYAEIEFLDSDAKPLENGYVPKENRKTVLVNTYIERNPIEVNVLEKKIYPKSGVSGYGIAKEKSILDNKKKKLKK